MTEHETLVQWQASQTLELADEARRLLWNRPWQKANAARLSLLVRGRQNQVAPPEQNLLDVVYLLGSETNTEPNTAEETLRTAAEENPGAAETLQFLLDEVKIRQSVVAARSAQDKGDYRNAAEQYREAWRTRLAAERRVPEGAIDHPWWDIAELYSDQNAALVEAYGLPEAEATRLVNLKAEMGAMYRRHATETEPLDLIQHAIRHARWGNRPLVQEALELAQRWSEGADPACSLAQQMSRLLPLWIELEDRLWQSPEQPEEALRAYSAFEKNQDRQSLQDSGKFSHQGVSDQLAWFVNSKRDNEAIKAIQRALRFYLFHHSGDGSEEFEAKLSSLVHKDWYGGIKSVFPEIAEIQKQRAKFYRDLFQDAEVSSEEKPPATLGTALAGKYETIGKAIQKTQERLQSADQAGSADQVLPQMEPMALMSSAVEPAKNACSTLQPTPRPPESEGLRTGRQKLLAGQYKDAIKELTPVLEDVSAGRRAARLLVIAKTCRVALQQGTPLSPNQIQYLVEAADDLETDAGLEIAQAKLEVAGLQPTNDQSKATESVGAGMPGTNISVGQQATGVQPKMTELLAGLTLLNNEIGLRCSVRKLVTNRMTRETETSESGTSSVRPLIVEGNRVANEFDLANEWGVLYKLPLDEYQNPNNRLSEAQQVKGDKDYAPIWYKNCRQLLESQHEGSSSFTDPLELQKTVIALAMVEEWLPAPTSEISQHQRLSDDNIQTIRKKIEDARWSLIENALTASVTSDGSEEDEPFPTRLDGAITQFTCLYWDAGDETTQRLREKLAEVTDEQEESQAEDSSHVKKLGTGDLQRMLGANRQKQRQLFGTSAFVHIFESIDKMRQENKP